MADWDNTQDSATLNEARLFHHILEKGFQAGSLVGLPIAGFLYYRNKPNYPTERFLSTLGKSAVGVVLISGLMGFARVSQIPKEEFADGMQDRAYRLHYNKGQRRTDLFAEIGGAAGGIAAMSFVGRSASVVLGGAALGTAAGVLVHVATMNDAAKSKDV